MSKMNYLKGTIATILLSVSIAYGYYYLINALKRMSYGILSFTHIRYYWFNLFPILLFSPYYFLNEFVYNQNFVEPLFFKIISILMVLSIIPLLGYIIYNDIILNVPFNKNMGLNWKYYVPYGWIIGFFACYLLFMEKTKNSYLSLNFATQAIAAGGYIYELPITASLRLLFRKSCPLYIYTPALAIFFMIYILKNCSWKPTKIFYLTLIVFLISSIAYYIFNSRYPPWIPRIPMIFLLISLTDGIPKCINYDITAEISKV